MHAGTSPIHRRAVRGLDPRQRLELAAVSAAIESSPTACVADRKQLIDSVRGRYRHVPKSSEAFVSRKRENSNWTRGLDLHSRCRRDDRVPTGRAGCGSRGGGTMPTLSQCVQSSTTRNATSAPRG